MGESTLRRPANPQHVVLLHHLRRVLVAASEARMDLVPLKGAHLITSVYGCHEDRGVMADIDLLVRPVDWARSGALLRGLGFRLRRGGWWSSSASHAHEVGFTLALVPGQELLFEVHRYLFDPLRLPIDHEAVWSRTVASTLDGAPCRRLAPEDAFVHVILHAVVHRLARLPRTLDDLDRLLRRGGVQIDAIVSRAQEWRITRATWLMLLLLARRTPETGLLAAARRLEPSPTVRSALRWLVPDGAGHRLARLPYRWQAAAVWPLLFDGWTDVARMFVGHPALRRLAAPW